MITSDSASPATASRPARGSARRRRVILPSSVIAAGVTFCVLLPLYTATAAPDLTFWDAAEFVTAAHTLGIPHPPGTPLWTLLANVVARLFSATGPVRSVTMLSVVTTAFACAGGASMAARWIGTRGAVMGAVSAGTMMSVWSNATETEVYGASLLLAVCMLVAGERAGRHDATDDMRARWRGLIAFLAGLAVPLHLSALVALPAAIAFAWHGPRPRMRDVLAWCALGALALSAVAVLPLRAATEPGLDSGHPVTLRALIAVLRREQFEVPGLWPRTAPLWLQIGNFFQWADWQVAFGLHPATTPSWIRTPLSVVWAWCAAIGLRAVWRHEVRVGRALALLLVSATLGVVVWLNMRAGPSFGHPVLPPGAIHEARERDYFFALGFWTWGLAAGIGITAMAQRLGARLSGRVRAVVIAAGIAVAALPVAANAGAMRRDAEPLAILPRLYARLLLDAVPPNTVLFVAGDNDTFPLWYLQQVEEHRVDVTIVTVPLLGAAWYRDEMRHRHRLLPPAMVPAWPGMDALLRSIAGSAVAQRRPVRVSSLVERKHRDGIGFGGGWTLQGLVYAPEASLPPGEVTLDRAALLRAADQVPPSAFSPLPRGIDGAGAQIQELLRCTRISARSDSLLVSACNGA